jgi:RNA polymerase sigma factor (sigma-70 family)
VKTSDRDLIRRIAERGDPAAFSKVLSEYTGMVYSTCWRILRDETQAADVSQETFYELFKHAGRISGCLGAWLHRVATRRAIDLIRQESSRRRREQLYLCEHQSEPSSWSEVEPLVDGALEMLPDDLRELVTLHYLQRKTTLQIAASKGISQPTVSRRISEAVGLVREHLRSQGVTIALVPLQTLLLHSSRLAPEILCRKLGKMALAHAASLSGAGKGLGLSTAAKLALAASVAAVLFITLPRLKETPAKPLITAAPVTKPQSVPTTTSLAKTETPQGSTPEPPSLPRPAPILIPVPEVNPKPALPIIPLLAESKSPPPSNAPAGPLAAKTEPATKAPPQPIQKPRQIPAPPQTAGFLPQPFKTYNTVPYAPFPQSPSFTRPPLVPNRRDSSPGQTQERSRQLAIIPRTR